MPKNESRTEQDAILAALNLSEDDRRYIEVNQFGVSLKFPLKILLGFAIGTEKQFSLTEKRLRLDSKAQECLYEMLTPGQNNLNLTCLKRLLPRTR